MMSLASPDREQDALSVQAFSERESRFDRRRKLAGAFADPIVFLFIGGRPARVLAGVEISLFRWMAFAVPMLVATGLILFLLLNGLHPAGTLGRETASANMVIPVVIAIAQAARVDPVPPALGACFGASFGFMLPVSTPPNATVLLGLRILYSLLSPGLPP